MIFHICHPINDWPPNAFFKAWGKPMDRRFCTLHINQIGRTDSLPFGTYLFSDLELFSEGQKELLATVWDQLAEYPENAVLQNHPLRAISRYDLLKKLYESGQNLFRALRLSELPSDLRFPVFLRMEHDHKGSRSPLIENWDQLESEAAKLVLDGLNPNRLLAVEYLETIDEKGLYRKYSYFKIGQRFIPRHIFFSRNWVNKDPDIAGDEQIREERAFLESNPHEDFIRDAFALAQIDYGRIDYSIMDGKLQVWEINTNPIVTLPMQKYERKHIANQEFFALQALAAFQELDCIKDEGRVPISLRWPLQITAHR